jgi:hypothetical protein
VAGSLRAESGQGSDGIFVFLLYCMKIKNYVVLAACEKKLKNISFRKNDPDK